MIRITAGALARFTEQAAKIANRAMPIMAATKINTRGAAIHLNAAGLECRFMQVINSGGDENETVCLALDSEILYRISKSLDPDLVLEIAPKKKNNAVVYDPAGAFSYDVAGLAPDDFPEWREANREEHQERNIRTREFFEAIDSVAYAVAKSEPRRVFTGVAIFLDGSTVLACGTDGKMLAVARREIPAVDPDYRASIVLPLSAVARLREFAGGSATKPESEFGLSIEEGFLRASGENADGNWLFEASAIEGHYPNFAAVIPKNPHPVAKVDRAELLAQIHRARAILKDPNAPVVFRFCNQEMRVEGVSFDHGAYHGSASAETPYGEFRVGFNTRYLEATIRSLAEGNPVVLRGVSPERPVLFSAGEDKTGDVHLVMPIKISELGTRFFGEKDEADDEVEEEEEVEK